MSLIKYLNKTVAITADNSKIFFGTVDEYFYPDENGYNSESIVLRTPNCDLYEFTEDAIEAIIIIE